MVRRPSVRGEARSNGQHPLAKAAQVAQRRIRAAAKWRWEQGEHREVLCEYLVAFEEVDMRGGDGKMAAMEAWAEREGDGTSSAENRF